MKFRKQRFSIIVACLVVFGFGFSFGLFYTNALAQEPVVSQTSIRQRTKELHDNAGKEWTEEEIAAAKADFAKLTQAEVCEERTRNLSARIEFYRNNHDEFTDAYEQIYENAVNASAKLLAENFDTKELDKKVEGLEDDLFALKSNYFTLIDLLEANLEQVCASEEGSTFAQINTLKDANTLLATLQTSAEEVRKQAVSVLTEMQELKSIESE